MRSKLLIGISILIGALLILSTIFIIHNYNISTKNDFKEVYGIIVEKYDDSFRIKETTSNKESTYLYDHINYNIGDLVLVKLRNDKVNEVALILEKDYSTKSVIIVEDISTTTSTTITEVTTSTKKTTKGNTTQPVAVTSDKDEDALKYFDDLDKEISSSKDNSPTFKEKAKEKFITLVDFIFYDGTINGYTFDQVKDTTKAKAIYYALIVDSKIEKKFPNYKENIGEKYKDIKGKLVAKYLDLKYDICEKGPEGCEQASEDLKLLKYSLGLTWDVVKSAFTYVKNLTVPKIQSWYESFKS